jgi:hypothetical protein
MKTLFLTAILTLTISTVANAFEVQGEECPALAESNKREGKVIKETSQTVQSDSTDVISN